MFVLAVGLGMTEMLTLQGEKSETSDVEIGDRGDESSDTVEWRLDQSC
jgi:hypothetical protein